MKRFKYIGINAQYLRAFKNGEVYEGNYIGNQLLTPVSTFAQNYPSDWEEVVEGQVSVDPVNPQHYKNGDVECIEAIKSATVGKDGFAGYLVGNLIKYVWRYESKNGVEDLKKGLWYLNKLIEHENDKGNTSI